MFDAPLFSDNSFDDTMFGQSMNMDNDMNSFNVDPTPQEMNLILQQLFAQQQQIENKINALTTTSGNTTQYNAMGNQNSFAFQAQANLPSLDGTSSTYSNIDLSQYSSKNANSNFNGTMSSSSFPMNNAIFSTTQQTQQQQQSEGNLWSDRASTLLGNIVCTDPKEMRKNKRKANKDKPKRPLSAYNIFFKEERARLLSGDAGDDVGRDQRTASGKIKFANLAKIISAKWQSLEETDLVHYKAEAATDLERYRKAMAAWKSKKEQQQEDSEELSSVEESTGADNNSFLMANNNHLLASLEQEELQANRFSYEAV